MVNFLVWLLAHLYAQPVDHYWNGFVQNCIHFQIFTNSSYEWIFSHLLYNIIQFCCNIWSHNHPYTSERICWDPALLSSICKAIWSVQKSWNSVSTFYINVLGSSSIWTFRISNICCWFLQAGALEKIKTNMYSKFDTSKLMSYQGHKLRNTW